MEKWKKIGKALLFPNKFIVMTLFPIAMILLVFSMIYFGTQHVFSYISYALAFYSLTIVSVRIPQIIRFFKKLKEENKYILRYKQDINLRINISLYGSLFINVAYSIFQFCLGLYHKSFWFYSMAVYYVLLSLVRFYLVSHTKKYKPGENLLIEYKRYNFCGWIMLLMNLKNAEMILFRILKPRGL